MKTFRNRLWSLYEDYEEDEIILFLLLTNKLLILQQQNIKIIKLTRLEDNFLDSYFVYQKNLHNRLLR